MNVSVEYVVRETAANLWRNRIMALAAVLTVAVSLSLVGTALLLRQGVKNQIGVWSSNVSIQIFARADVSNGQLADIRSQIGQTPQITRCTYLNHERSYLQAKHLFASQPSVWQALSPATTPPVFNCQLKSPNEASVVAANFNGLPGVMTATYPSKSLQLFEKLTNVLQAVFLVIAVVLLVSSLVLILTAIRMAIFARRREVGVMKLVGATNWFIRVPFMLEGLVQGLLGSVIAGATVLVGNVLFRDFIRSHVSALSQAVVPSQDLVLIEILI